jgi:hypothetical protein
VYSVIIVFKLIIAFVDVPPTWVTFEGKLTGGMVAAFTVSTIVVPGTWG